MANAQDAAYIIHMILSSTYLVSTYVMPQIWTGENVGCEYAEERERDERKNLT